MFELDPPVPSNAMKKVEVISDAGEITRLTDNQKNVFYARAKLLKEKIRSALLSMAESHDASEHNVLKHLKTESTPEHQKNVEEFRNLMIALGADPKDFSVEKLRRAR